ncbi:MAG TPA: RNA methyltransferase [Gemmatimonadaceae bacterium]|nr:RNA methyltransferase [Gemmatimonadaceae bacterium]
MKLLTLARDLQRRKARERQELFVAEGIRAVEELLRSTLHVRGALVSPELATAPRGKTLRGTLATRQIELLEVTERDFASAAGTESPQGVLAIAEVPRRSLESLGVPSLARLLVLDGVQDPGNAGTLLRTAAALAAHATLALPGTVDLWNPKVVRSAMGALFHRSALSCTWDELGRFLRENQVVAWGASAEGEPIDHIDARDAPQRLALVVGNEGSGLSDEARALLERTVSIPISEDVESLNVAVAAGIILHHLRPKAKHS